jgi:uncharacterized membrane protein
MEEFYAIPPNALPPYSKSLWQTPPGKRTTGDSLELVIGIYQAESTSKWVLKSLERLQRERAIAMVSTAVLVKTETGRLQTRQIVDWNLAQGGLIDGLSAALIALFNPMGDLGAIAFHSGGLAVEVLVDNLAEIGLTPAELETFAQEVRSQSSILIALTKRPWLNRLTLEMAHVDAQIVHKSLVAPLRGHLDEHFINLAQAVTLENSRNPYHT